MEFEGVRELDEDGFESGPPADATLVAMIAKSAQRG